MAEKKARAAGAARTTKTGKTPARAKAPAAAKTPAKARTPRAAASTARVAETVTSKAPAAKPAVAKGPASVETFAAPLVKTVETLAPKPVQAVQPALKAIDLAVEALAAAPKAAQAIRPDQVVAPVASLMEAGAEQARQAYARAQATTEALRQAVTESATVTSRGALEINGKVIEALRAQSDAAFDLWRSALSAGSVSEAIRVQTSGTRHVYETTASQWKDIAETAGRWFSATVRPMQSVWTNQGH